jgi:uncharacterized protein YkwD
MNLRRILTTAAVGLIGLAAVPAANASSFAENLLQEINTTRAEHGLFRLQMSSGLTLAAQRHSVDMLRRQYFAHTSPTGVTLLQRVVASRFQTSGTWYAGEVLSWSYGSKRRATEVVKMWMASPTHRRVLLSTDPRFAWVGLGRADGRFMGHDDVRLWTVDLGQR